MSDITYISDNDLSVRLKSLKCCLAEKGYSISRKLQMGMDCAVDIKEFNVANVAYNILSCTTTNLTAYDYTYTNGTPRLVFNFSSSTYNLTITDGIITVGTLITYNQVGVKTLTQFVEDFCLAYREFNYTIVGENLTILTNDCTYSGLTMGLQFDVIKIPFQQSRTFTECAVIENTYVYNNQNDANCLTVNQIISIFEYLEQYCCKCFPLYGELDNNPIIT